MLQKLLGGFITAKLFHTSVVSVQSGTWAIQLVVQNHRNVAVVGEVMAGLRIRIPLEKSPRSGLIFLEGKSSLILGSMNAHVVVATISQKNSAEARLLVITSSIRTNCAGSFPERTNASAAGDESKEHLLKVFF